MSIIRMVQAARTNPAWFSNPPGIVFMVCHEFVLGCLLYAENAVDPWGLVTAINRKLGGGQKVGKWMGERLYSNSIQLKRRWLHDNVSEGDILFTLSPGSRPGVIEPPHSMVVVDTSNNRCSIRGFNNSGTFTGINFTPSPSVISGYVYDNYDREIDANGLWHGNNGFGASPPGNGLWRLRYDDAVRQLNKMLRGRTTWANGQWNFQ